MAKIVGVMSKNIHINVLNRFMIVGRVITIAKLLNAENLKTAKGKEWKNTNVYSVLKRYAERQARLQRQSYTSEMKLSKMKLEWLKD